MPIYLNLPYPVIYLVFPSTSSTHLPHFPIHSTINILAIYLILPFTLFYYPPYFPCGHLLCFFHLPRFLINLIFGTISFSMLATYTARRKLAWIFVGVAFAHTPARKYIPFLLFAGIPCQVPYKPLPLLTKICPLPRPMQKWSPHSNTPAKIHPLSKPPAKCYPATPC